MNSCSCGKQKLIADLQCAGCRKEAMGKLVKICAAVGVILGLLCSSLPPKYQAPCKAISGILSAC